ncbi:hypothetical protein KBC80_01485 [Candidatus Woesebacteria bacterium]|jgi:hypothetical protein|nr:hypothetical protein [Candidatus Woesebacteria bacterium]
MDAIVKVLQISFVLSPLFITGIALGLLLKKGIKLAQGYALYWLLLSIIFLILWLAAFADKQAGISTLLMLGTSASSAFSIYLSMRKQDR